MPTVSSMNATGSAALGKGVKITVGLSPSTSYAIRTRNSYFPPDHKIERGICRQDAVYV